MGAIAYAWSFAKDPLGGVTPIESMLAERARPRRLDPMELAESDGDAGARGLPALAGARPAGGALGGALGGEGRLVQASVPLSVSGFTARTVAELTEAPGPVGLGPMQAGGGGRRPPGKLEAGHVEPGPAIGVELVRGDMSMGGTGTVTYIDGATVLAFGPPMFGIGESYLPLVDA